MADTNPVVFKVSRVGDKYVMATSDERSGTNRPSPECDGEEAMAVMFEVAERFMRIKGIPVVLALEV